MITFTVAGEPFGKKRPRASSFGGHARIHNDPENERYELKVMNAYLMSQGLTQAPEKTMYGKDEPLFADIQVFFPIPKSFSKKKYKQAEDSEIYPLKKPDIDNCCKAILDSLNKLCYTDDSQVVCLIANKFYTPYEPKVKVSIWRKGEIK